MRQMMSSVTLSAIVRELREQAVLSGTLPPDVARQAEERTLAKVMSSGPEGWSHKRLKAYFDAVATRRLIRARAGGDMVTRLVASSIVADLIAGGRSSAAAYCELEHGWGNTMSRELLEEFRMRLCA